MFQQLMRIKTMQKRFYLISGMWMVALLVILRTSDRFPEIQTFIKGDNTPNFRPAGVQMENEIDNSNLSRIREPSLLVIDGKNTETTQTVFIYKPVHWLVDWVGNEWESSNIFEPCPVKNCILTKENTYINKADAVLFRVYHTKECRKKKKPGQIWIFFEHEAPPQYLRNYQSFKPCHRNVFNWTMTYRRDSDFTLVHGHFAKARHWHNDSVLDSLLRSKSKTAVGFISNCNSQSKRGDYIKLLRANGVDIDIYGKCGNLRCNDGDRYKAAWNTSFKSINNCFDVLDSNYKFYLSFESSLCDDYVTEKSFHLVLRHHIVPVIRDASNHSLFHPPKSYIDTKDFSDVKSLANYLKYLAGNPDEIKEYYRWRERFSVQTVNSVLQTNFCNLCQRLHNQEKYKRVYDDVGRFLMFKGDELSPICHTPMNIG